MSAHDHPGYLEAVLSSQILPSNAIVSLYYNTVFTLVKTACLTGMLCSTKLSLDQVTGPTSHQKRTRCAIAEAGDKSYGKLSIVVESNIQVVNALAIQSLHILLMLYSNCHAKWRLHDCTSKHHATLLMKACLVQLLGCASSIICICQLACCRRTCDPATLLSWEGSLHNTQLI